jgi:hypothetical protein
MEKKTSKTHRKRYPRKALVPIYWVIIGISFIFVWILPMHSLHIYTSYIQGMIVGLTIWTPFMVGAILYSNYFQRQGIRICGNCGKYAYKGKTYCEKCGARVFWRCPKCSARTSKGLDFCKECGQSLKVVTFARQLEFDEDEKKISELESKNENKVVVTGSIVQFCPACGAEISEDLTHCSICGSKFEV